MYNTVIKEVKDTHMKLRIEISDGEEEVVIRCKAVDDRIIKLQKAVNGVIRSGSELKLYIGATEYYVAPERILFFETNDGRLTAHTADNMFYSDSTLRDLPSILPKFFVRVSKSCILNAMKVSSIDKNLTGASTAFFTGSHKKAFVSRMYYNELKEIINEMRILK